MVTIATFSKPEEAHLFRMRLEAGGIQAFVQDEHLIQMNWMYSNAIGGVRVQIFEEDIPLANEILQEEAVELPDSVLIACPFCGSQKTKQDELPRRIAFLSLLLFNFPFLYAKRRYECEDCGKKWKESQKNQKIKSEQSSPPNGLPRHASSLGSFLACICRAVGPVPVIADVRKSQRAALLQ